MTCVCHLKGFVTIQGQIAASADSSKCGSKNKHMNRKLQDLSVVAYNTAIV